MWVPGVRSIFGGLCTSKKKLPHGLTNFQAAPVTQHEFVKHTGFIFPPLVCLPTVCSFGGDGDHGVPLLLSFTSCICLPAVCSHNSFVFPSFVHLSAVHLFGGDGGHGVPLLLSLTSCLDGEESGVVSVAVVKLKTA